MQPHNFNDMCVHLGILSWNRKLRFAFKVLLSEIEKSQIDFVMEGTSIHELGVYVPQGLNPAVLLLDYRQIYCDEQLYFKMLRAVFPDSAIILIVDAFYRGQGISEARQIVLEHSSTQQLVTAICKATSYATERPSTILDFSLHMDELKKGLMLGQTKSMFRFIRH